MKTIPHAVAIGLLVLLAAPALAEVCQGSAISKAGLAESDAHTAIFPDETAVALPPHLQYCSWPRDTSPA